LEVLKNFRKFFGTLARVTYMARDFFISCAVEIGVDSCGLFIRADIEAAKVGKSPPRRARCKIELKF